MPHDNLSAGECNTLEKWQKKRKKMATLRGFWQNSADLLASSATNIYV